MSPKERKINLLNLQFLTTDSVLIYLAKRRAWLLKWSPGRASVAHSIHLQDAATFSEAKLWTGHIYLHGWSKLNLCSPTGHISHLSLPLPTVPGPDPVRIREMKQEAFAACFPRFLRVRTSKSPGSISSGTGAALKEQLGVGQHDSTN